MPRTTDLMPSFGSVPTAGNAGTATLRMDIGYSYHKLLLNYSGVTLAQMKEIRLLGDGRVMRTYRGGDFLDELNQFDLMQAAAGILTLDFRRKVRTKQGEDITVIGTGMNREMKKDLQKRLGKSAVPDALVNMQELSTLTLEIDVDAAHTGASFEARAIRTGPWPLGMVLKINQYGYSPPASGEYEISDLPKGDIFNRVIFKSDKILRLQVLRDNKVDFDRTKAENELIQKDGKYRSPNSDWFVYDPTEEGDGSEGLVTRGIHDLRFRLFMSGPDDVPVVVERLGYMER